MFVHRSELEISSPRKSACYKEYDKVAPYPQPCSTFLLMSWRGGSTQLSPETQESKLGNSCYAASSTLMMWLFWQNRQRNCSNLSTLWTNSVAIGT